MENSSRALIMAAEILIAVMVISLLVYIFSMLGNFSGNMQEQMNISAVGNFNNHFLSNEYRIDLTANDVISAINFAREWNIQHGYSIGGSLSSHNNDIYYVTVRINGKDVFDSTTETKYYFSYSENQGAQYTEKVNSFLNENIDYCYACCSNQPTLMSDSDLTNAGVTKKLGKRYFKRTSYVRDIVYNDKTGMIRSINFKKIDDTNYKRSQLADVIIL